MAGGSEGREFSFLTAWCMKLSLSLVVRQRRLLYLLPEGRRLNRLCAGWLVSLAIEVAFRVRRVVYMSFKEGSGSGAPVILPAVFTMRCSAFLLWSVQLLPHTVLLSPKSTEILKSSNKQGPSLSWEKSRLSKSTQPGPSTHHISDSGDKT